MLVRKTRSAPKALRVERFGTIPEEPEPQEAAVEPQPELDPPPQPAREASSASSS